MSPKKLMFVSRRGSQPPLIMSDSPRTPPSQPTRVTPKQPASAIKKFVDSHKKQPQRTPLQTVHTPNSPKQFSASKRVASERKTFQNKVGAFDTTFGTLGAWRQVHCVLCGAVARWRGLCFSTNSKFCRSTHRRRHAVWHSDSALVRFAGGARVRGAL